MILRLYVVCHYFRARSPQAQSQSHRLCQERIAIHTQNCEYDTRDTHESANRDSRALYRCHTERALKCFGGYMYTTNKQLEFEISSLRDIDRMFVR